MASLVTHQLLDAISKAESSNNPHVKAGDQGASVGQYQMKSIAYKDVQQFFPKQFGAVPYEKLKTDPTLQRQAAQAYLQVGEQKYGITNPDRLISFYNRGPKAAQGPIANMDYVQKVRTYMGQTPMSSTTPEQPASMGDSIEQGLRRIFRHTVAAGFAPPSPKDMEQMLAKVEPPTALPGVSRPAPDRQKVEQGAVSAMHQAFQSQGQTPPTAPAPAASSPMDALKGAR